MNDHKLLKGLNFDCMATTQGALLIIHLI